MLYFKVSFCFLNIGHYLSDVLDLRTDKWYSFDDKEVRQTTEAEVQKVRQDSGYIFFYLSK